MYQIIILPHFRKQLKGYVKKYRDLKDAVIRELENFDKKKYVCLGSEVYKIRLKTKSLSKGKSKASRLIVLVVEVENLLIPITVYFKGAKNSISKKELNDHLESILFELESQSLLR